MSHVCSATGIFLSGETKGSWTEDFKHNASEGADAMTPVGKHFLEQAFNRQ